MHAVNTQTAWLKITLESVHVNQEQRAIRCWAVFPSNTVQLIINVHRERFARPEFVQPFVHRIVNVSLINCACKEFANQLVTTIQLVPISNSVKIIFARRKFGVAVMRTVCRKNDVKSIHTADPSVEMLAKDVCFAVEMPNAQHETTMHCARANKVLSMMAKADADESNVKETTTVHRINFVRKMFAN